MNNLRITTVQSPLHWEDAASNLLMFSEQLSHLADRTDVVVLPEMFTTGFTMNAEALAERMDGRTLNWMAKQAQLLGAVITGSVIIEDNTRYYNRCIWMRPDGSFDYYDKRHLFTLADEHEVYTPGKDKLITRWKGWKICPMICYDLRFPVWARNSKDYDLLIFMANWPETRNYHWKQLLIARAIENQCYIAGVNRVGSDGKGFKYSGDSAVIDYAGQILYQATYVHDVFTCVLDKDEMSAYREKLNFLPDRDKFKIL